MQIGFTSPMDNLIEVNAVKFHVFVCRSKWIALLRFQSMLMSKPSNKICDEMLAANLYSVLFVASVTIQLGTVLLNKHSKRDRLFNPWICIMNDLWTDYGTLLICMYVLQLLLLIFFFLIWLVVVWLLCLLFCSWHWFGFLFILMLVLTSSPVGSIACTKTMTVLFRQILRASYSLINYEKLIDMVIIYQTHIHTHTHIRTNTFLSTW